MDMPDSLTGNKELPSTRSLVADVVSFKVEGDMEYEVIKLNKLLLISKFK